MQTRQKAVNTIEGSISFQWLSVTHGKNDGKNDDICRRGQEQITDNEETTTSENNTRQNNTQSGKV